METSVLEETVEKTLKEILSREEQIRRLSREVSEFEEALDILAGQPEKTQGTIRVSGLTLEAKLTRKQNVKYTDKDKLVTLIQDNAEKLKGLFRFEVKESGQKVFDFLEQEQDLPLSQQLEAIRVVSKGKTGFEIVALKGR